MGRCFLRRAPLALFVLGLCCCVLSAAPVAFGQDPDPATTVPADPGGGGGNPNPDPAPEPAPPPAQPSSPPPVAPSPPPAAPPPAVVAPPAAPPVTAGPTPEEIERQEARQREREQRRAEAERRRRQAAREIRAAVKRESGEGYGVPGGFVWPRTAAQVEDPATVEGVTLDAEPTAAPASEAVAPVARVAAVSSSDSILRSAGPILIGLLLLAILLLGLAAIPSRSVSGGLASLVDQRRLEIGLIGTTLLAAAVIGLLVALLAR